MERPSDVAAVRRLVGLVNYLSKFLSKLSELCEPLAKGDSPTRATEQEKAFESVKQAVTSQLQFCDISISVNLLKAKEMLLLMV